jgi:hypothetical protein
LCNGVLVKGKSQSRQGWQTPSSLGFGKGTYWDIVKFGEQMLIFGWL